MSKTAEDILRSEWDLLKKTSILSQIGCSAGPKKYKGIYDMFHWNVLLPAPKHSLYGGYMFQFEIAFPSNYPNSPPTVTCKTDVYHMNISKSGDVLIPDIIKNGRKAFHDISTVIISIFTLFSKPNPHCAYRMEIANLYKSNHEQYEKNVKDYCAQHALKIA